MLNYLQSVYAPGSQSIIVKPLNKVIKIPLSPSSWQNLKHELHANKLARKDPFWMPYVAILKQFSLFGISKKLTSCSQHCQLVDALKRDLLKRIGKCKTYDLTKVINIQPLHDHVLSELSPNELSNFLKAAQNPVEISSCHGDICAQNILFDKASIRLIDWTNYQQQFWAYYDLMHYEIQYLANQSNYSWTRIVTNDGLFNHDLRWSPRDHFFYSLCRSFLELKANLRLNQFDSSYKTKYLKVIKTTLGYIS